MNKSKLNQQEIFTTQILILFATCIGAASLMWLLKMANYRMDYIFRHHMGIIMPILSLLALLLFGYLLFRSRKKMAEEEKIMSRSFTLYLSVAPLIAVLLPTLSLLGKHEQLFSLSIKLMVVALIAYFSAPLFYRLHSPAAAGICVMTDLAAILFIYFFRIYYSDSASIMAGTDLMRLTDWGCFLIIALLSVGFYAGWLYLAKKKPHFATCKFYPLIPLLLTLCATLTLCIHPLNPLIRTILFWGILGIQMILFFLFIFLKKKK